MLAVSKPLAFEPQTVKLMSLHHSVLYFMLVSGNMCDIFWSPFFCSDSTLHQFIGICRISRPIFNTVVWVTESHLEFQSSQAYMVMIQLGLRVGSIPDGVTGFFHLHNLSGCIVVLGLTKPLTEMSTKNVSWGWSRPVRRADNLTTYMCRLSWYPGVSAFWNPQGLSRDCFTFVL
jgi:hypothetical protein